MVYDELGKVVSIIADEQLLAGEQKYLFNGNNLAAGIYYCTLRAGTFTETKRLILSK